VVQADVNWITSPRSACGCILRTIFLRTIDQGFHVKFPLNEILNPTDSKVVISMLSRRTAYAKSETRRSKLSMAVSAWSLRSFPFSTEVVSAVKVTSTVFGTIFPVSTYYTPLTFSPQVSPKSCRRVKRTCAHPDNVLTFE
jgi:hypothetical protein